MDANTQTHKTPSKSQGKQFHITVAKEQRGNLLVDEIDCIVKSLKSLKHLSIIIVKEFRDKYKREYVHTHAYIFLTTSTTPELLRKRLKAKFFFYEHQKDIKIDHVYNPETLIGGYFTKQSDSEILFHNLTLEYTTLCKEKADEYTRRKYILKDKKVPSMNEMPYTIMEYVQANDISYHGDTDSFKYIIKDMIKSQDYVLTSQLKNLKSIKATLDILLDCGDALLNDLIEDQCARYETISNF